MKLDLRSLRWAAGGGLAVVLVTEFVTSVPWRPRQGYGLVLLIIMCVLVALVSRLLMPRAAGAVVRHTNLLLPLALLTIALKALEWLSVLPVLGSLLTRAWQPHIFSLGLALSLHLALVIALAVGYA